MSDLKTNLEQILLEKQTKIIPENIKKDIEIFGIAGTLEENTGIDTSDATATPNDILSPKTAYVKGQKITGNIEATYKVLSDVTGNTGNDSIECMKYVGNKYVLKIGTLGFRVYEIDEDTNTLILLDNETMHSTAKYDNFAISEITEDNDFRIIFTDTSKTNNLHYYRFDIATKKIVDVGTFRVFNNSKYDDKGFKIALSKNGTRLVEFIQQASSDNREIQLGNVSTTSITSNRQLYSQKYASSTFSVQFLNDDKLINVTFEDGAVLNNKQYILNNAYNYSTVYSAQYDFENTYKNLIFNNTCNYCYTGNAIYTVKYENNMYKPDTKVVDIDSSAYTFKGFVSSNYIAFNETLYKIANPLQQIQVYNHAIDTGVIDTAYAGIDLTNSVYYYTIVLDIDNQSVNIIDSLTTKDGVCWNLSDVGTTEDKVLSGYEYGNYNGIKIGTMNNNGDITITPTTEQQTKLNGYYNSLTVEAVTSDIDPNITSDNIKKDISILGVTGTYEGSSSSNNAAKIFKTKEEMQADSGAKEGDLAVVYREEIQNMTADTETQYIKFPNTVTLPENVSQNYSGTLIVGTSGTTYNLDLSSTEFRVWQMMDMEDYNLVIYTSTDGITYTKTTGDEYLQSGISIMFDEGTQHIDLFKCFLQVYVSVFDGLFVYKTSTYTQAPNQFKALSSDIYVKSAYSKDGVIEGTLTEDISNTFVDINAEVYTKIQQAYDNMEPRVLTDSNKSISRDTYLIPTKTNGIPLLDTSNVTSMSNLFYSCVNLTIIPLLNTSNVTNMEGMFYDCTSLITIPLLNTSKVISMSRMFYDCTSLVEVPVLDTGKVTSMMNMFFNCTSLSDDSLNNILQMCINASSYTKTKTLKYIGLTQEQATKCTTLSNYQLFTAAGWTTGY